MSKKHSEIFKLDTIHQYKAGISTTQLCKQVGIARSTLLLWVKQYSVNADGEVPRERYLLEKELEHLQTENAIFKTCGCSLSSPLSERLSAIHRYKDKFSIHALCRVLNVNRSTYYHYALRSPEKTQIQLQDDKLKPLIRTIFEKSCGRFGARKIRVKLAEQGHIASERRILRLMEELNLSAAGTKPRLNSANDRQYQYYPNKLKRNFLTDAPNKVWVSDIAYAKIGMDFLYLYSRKVIGYDISENIDTSLALSAFHQAYLTRKKLSVLLFIATKDHNIPLLNFAILYGITVLFSRFPHLVLLTITPLPSHFSPRSKRKIFDATITRPKTNSVQQ